MNTGTKIRSTVMRAKIISSLSTSHAKFAGQEGRACEAYPRQYHPLRAAAGDFGGGSVEGAVCYLFKPERIDTHTGNLNLTESQSVSEFDLQFSPVKIF